MCGGSGDYARWPALAVPVECVHIVFSYFPLINYIV